MFTLEVVRDEGGDEGKGDRENTWDVRVDYETYTEEDLDSRGVSSELTKTRKGTRRTLSLTGHPRVTHKRLFCY